MKTHPLLWLTLLLGLTATPQTSRAANLVINGGFENPPGIHPYQVFGAGSGAMPGWTIESGTVEITAGSYWQAAEGAQSLDLNGIFEAIGTISQDLATIPGQNYKVRFAYAGNPECGLPTLKTANAYWNSQLLTNLAFDITGYNNTNVGWIYYEQTVTAISSNSRIRFQATSPTFCGLTLDDVSVTAAGLSQTNDCFDPPAGIVSWWRGEGNALDSRGTNHGALQSGVSFTGGVAGSAFHFGRMNSGVNIPAAISLDVGLSQGMSVEAWIKPDDLALAQPLVEWFQPIGPPWGVHFWISEAGSGTGPGCLYVNVMDVCGAEHKFSSAAGVVAAGQWQHIAMTYDKASGSCRLFYNGNVVAEQNVGRFVLQTSYPLYLGHRPDGMFAGARYRGSMDEVGLYNRALTATEIQSIYAVGSAGNCGVTNPPPTPAIPVITSFNPVSATVGGTMTISGANFSPTASSNIVFFGAVRATVTAASQDNLAVTVPTGATYAPITLSVGGLVAYANKPFQPTFPGGSSNDIATASFAPRFDLAGGDGAHRSVIADLDGDGKPDITVADVYGHTISLFRNISSSGTFSNGSFAPRVVLPAEGGASDNPYGIVVADVDGDGKPDIVVCDRLGNNVSVYRNLATPGSLNTDSFAPHLNYSVGADPRYARVADLDGDGRPDIVSANYAANTISILRNTGVAGSLNANSFAPAVSLPAGGGPYDVAVGDLDGDNKPDLAVACANGPTLLYRNVASPGALTANSFAAHVGLEAATGNITIALGDIDGDGKSDIIIGSYQSGTMSVYRNQSSPGPFTTGSFAPRVDFSNGNWTHTVALGDLNGDARTDIATVGELSSYLSVYQNLSMHGSFTNGSLAPRVDFGAGWNAWGLSIGDLDGDGRPDLVFCNAYDDTVSIYQNVMPFTNAPPPQTNGCVASSSGLVGWWRAEGNGTDVTGAHDGGFPFGIAYSNGVAGQAFDFDGSTRRVSIPDDPAFILTNAMTLEAWVYPRAYGGFITFRGDNRGGLDNWFLDTYQPGYVNFGIIDEANNASMVLAPLALNQWQHVAATWDRATGDMKVFVNGVLAGQTNTTLIPVGVLDAGNEPGIGIGNHGGTFHQFPFNGLIDELAIYSRALSAAEVTAIHAAGSAGKCTVSNPPPPVPILAGPITNAANGHWYYLLNATNWPAAEEIAVSLGGHLVTINDAAENNWVFANFSSFGGIERPLWIGLTDQASEGDWRWISGDSASFRNWSPIEPNSGGGYFPDEDHALIWHPSSGYPLGSWNDAPSNQLWYAVVEVGTNSPPVPPILAGPITNSANGHWYYLLDATNWPAAEAIAVSLGGHLATINDAAENNWVFANFSNFGGVERTLWIGLNDAAQEGDWQWVSGQPASYVNWAPGEPNSGGGFFPDEDQALIWHPSAEAPLGSWNDAPYNQHHAAVVEVAPPPSIPTTILAGPIINSENGHWYYLLDATNWPAAEQIAVSLGGHLTTINHAGENYWVFLNFAYFGGVDRNLWIGLTDSAQEGNWRWVSGDSSNFRNWAIGEPNSGGAIPTNEDHAFIWNPGAYAPIASWNDAPGQQNHFAVVEVAPPLTNAPALGRISVAPSADPGTQFRLRFTGEPGRSYFIEATCDWVTWETVGVAADLGNGQFEFVDANAGRYSGRFYRTASP